MNYDDIFDVWRPETNSTFFVIIGLSIATVIIIGIIGYMWYKRYYNRPWIVASKQLKRLYIIHDKKKCYEELINILKKYVSIRYNKDVYNKTESELFLYLSFLVKEDAVMSEARFLIDNAVAVKFGGGVSSDEYVSCDIAKDVERALCLIQVTIPSL
ncbi:MAG: hypothetical protein WC707_03045 [Candidatus Babeliaceae bacterium]